MTDYRRKELVPLKIKRIDRTKGNKPKGNPALEDLSYLPAECLQLFVQSMKY